jgi:hypothetical protein
MRLLYDIENHIERCPLSFRQMARHARMDQEQFKDKLTEVAEWYTLKEDNGGKIHCKRKRENEQLMELAGENDLETENICEPDVTVNESRRPIAIKKLKIQPCTCEDCGKWCENGRKTQKKIYETGKRHWRYQCLTCHRWRNPETGIYELTNATAAPVYIRYIKNQIELEKNQSLINKKSRATPIESNFPG